MGSKLISKSDYSSRQVAWFAFSLAVALLAIIGFLAYRATNRLVASEQLISHTREIQTLLEDIRSDVLQASNARRGFIITGLQDELAAHSAAVADLPGKLQHLKTNIADNPSQQRRSAALENLIQDELGLIQQSIDLRRQAHADQQRQVAFTRRGSSKIAAVFAAIREMEDEENRLLHERRAQADKNYKHTTRVLGAASVLAIFVIFVNFYQLNRELRERQGAERLAQERLQLINAFFSSSTVGFAILDSELRYQRVNEVLAQMAGLKAEDVMGQPLPALFAGQGKDIDAILRDVIKTGQAVLDREVSIEVPGKPGELRQWTLNCFPLRDARGQVARVGFIVLDVTARHNAEAAYRRLSSRLLRLQDEERRRIAREMHDSLGQYLTALKIDLEVAMASPPEQKAELLGEAVELAGSCLSETRTLSHLLHPPLLDEAGLASAARWYVTGFAERSGIKVNLDLPADFGRLPLPIETALFRVLQESLTNIHRHSRSSAADIQMQRSDGHVTLTVRDFGVGIPLRILQRFQQSGTTGVGLAGMRERIYELGGSLDIRREEPGTTVYASVPVTTMQTSSTAADSAA